MNSRPALRVPDRGPLHLIIRGDAYPVAGGSWSQMAVGLANHGPRGRTPAFVWIVALALCGDKDMATLGVLWAEHVQVRSGRGRAFKYCAFKPFKPSGPRTLNQV